MEWSMRDLRPLLSRSHLNSSFRPFKHFNTTFYNELPPFVSYRWQYPVGVSTCNHKEPWKTRGVLLWSVPSGTHPYNWKTGISKQVIEADTALEEFSYSIWAGRNHWYASPFKLHPTLNYRDCWKDFLSHLWIRICIACMNTYVLDLIHPIHTTIVHARQTPIQNMFKNRIWCASISREAHVHEASALL